MQFYKLVQSQQIEQKLMFVYICLFNLIYDSLCLHIFNVLGHFASNIFLIIQSFICVLFFKLCKRQRNLFLQIDPKIYM